MKALNRAIARTTGDITKLCAFHIDQLGTQGCAVKQTPETLKQLEQHLAALLAMERKQLEAGSMKEATLTGDGTGQALPELAQHLRTQLHPGSTRAMDDWTPGMVDRFNRMEPVQLQPSDSALEKACEYATNVAREAVRYMNQRDELMDVLVQVQSHFETGEIRHGLDIRQVVNCALEHFRRDGVGHKETAVTTRAFVKHQTKLHAQPLPTETEANLPPKPVRWYKSGVRSIGDLDLQSTPTAASEQPVPPAPDVINMTDPRNWQVGDVLMCSDGNAFLGFNVGDECAVAENNETYVVVRRNSGTAVALHHDKPTESAFFTWLRHGEAQQ